MKYYEIIKIIAELSRYLHSISIRPQDYRYTNLYDEYLQMVKSGEKVSYIVFILSQKYGISERTVYNIINRFSADVNEI